MGSPSFTNATRLGLYSLDDLRSLALEFRRVQIFALLFAILKSRTFVIFQHTVLAAEMPLTETAVSDNPLSGLFALLMRAAKLLWWHVDCRCACEVGNMRCRR
jgi:hypothetical protein